MLPSLLSFFLCVATPAFAEGTSVVGTKLVEIEWEEVPDATGYEVQLSPVPKGKPLVFRTSGTQFSEAVPFGQYWLRIRSKSKVGAFSPWSERAELDVVAKVLQLLEPADNAEIFSQGDAKQSVELKWSPVEKAKRYTLKVWTEVAKDKPYNFTTTTTSKRLRLSPGRSYYWQVTFESAGGVDYYQEPQTFTFTLNGTRLLAPSDLDPKTLSWKASPGAQAYQGKLFYRHLDETTWTLIKETKLLEPKWVNEKLKPGHYKLELVATAPRRMNSEVTVHEFMLKPTWDELSAQLVSLKSTVEEN
jgi:hypothetical protein